MKINATLAQAVRYVLGVIGWIQLGAFRAHSTCLGFVSGGEVE
jgi:hypothetical protein